MKILEVFLNPYKVNCTTFLIHCQEGLVTTSQRRLQRGLWYISDANIRSVYERISEVLWGGWLLLGNVLRLHLQSTFKRDKTHKLIYLIVFHNLRIFCGKLYLTHLEFSTTSFQYSGKTSRLTCVEFLLQCSTSSLGLQYSLMHMVMYLSEMKLT